MLPLRMSYLVEPRRWFQYPTRQGRSMVLRYQGRFHFSVVLLGYPTPADTIPHQSFPPS